MKIIAKVLEWLLGVLGPCGPKLVLAPDPYVKVHNDTW